jgi:hypothetical protein
MEKASGDLAQGVPTHSDAATGWAGKQAVPPLGESVVERNQRSAIARPGAPPVAFLVAEVHHRR